MNKCLVLLAASLLFFGCSYNESKIKDEKAPPLTQKITSPEQITYKLVHESVLQNACLRCHSAAGGNRGGINLESYQNVFKNSHQIRIEVAGATMPPSDKLTAEQIKLVTDWIDAGASENGKVAGELPTPAPTPPPPTVPTPGPAPKPTPLPIPVKISFDEVLKKVIKTNCLKCHSEIGGNSGELNFETYESVFENRNRIKNEVSTDQMPPKNGVPLTIDQKKLILTWIDQGSLK